jgi:hypothetical protein
MCSNYLPFNDPEMFGDALRPLEERLPDAMAFLKRIGCVGLKIDTVGSHAITLVPLMPTIGAHEELTRTRAKELGMTEHEEEQFITRTDQPDKLYFSEPWQWGPPRFHWQKQMLATRESA